MTGAVLIAAKREIRKAMLGCRQAQGGAWLAAASAAIAERVRVLDAYQASSTVCLFAALEDEVRLDALRPDSLAAGRRVLLPAWRPGAGVYGFKDWGMDIPLRAGHWGVSEPVVEGYAELSGEVCVITPGVAFDAGGGRIGYGGGHYDRLLRLPVGAGGRIRAVGVCFDFQVQEALPQAPWDQPVDVVITERRTIRCAPASGLADNTRRRRPERRAPGGRGDNKEETGI